MLAGGGNGTYWERAQAEAMASTTADIDGDGTVEVTESAQWVIANRPADDSARLPQPSVFDLTSPVRDAPSSLDGMTDEAWTLPARGGTLAVSMERFRVSTTYKDGSARRALLVEGGAIYIDNLTTGILRSDAIYDFVIVRGPPSLLIPVRSSIISRPSTRCLTPNDIALPSSLLIAETDAPIA
jgi:hypothetical protein